VTNVFQLPGAVLDEPRPAAPSLNLSEREIVDAAGGYVRPAEQLRELHARGFSRAYIPKVGRKHVVLERAHYDAVTRGQFGPAPANDVARPAAPAPNRAALRQFFKQKRKL
jgi:hypothetical protein